MNSLNGLLLVDKSPGCTSHDVVARARRILGLRAIGHAGTLDPLASGLLVLLLGEGTKISDYVLQNHKAYETKIRLGIATDTMDTTGTVVEERPFPTDPAVVGAAVSSLSGDLDMDVPVHSAVKVDGKKLYEYARAHLPVVLPRRTMSFYDVTMLEFAQDARGAFVRVGLACSKGSFIRAWAGELGRRRAVEELRRLRSEPYSVADAISLETLDGLWRGREERHGALLGPAWVPLKDALPSSPTIWLEPREETLLRNGQLPTSSHAELLRICLPGQPLPPVKALSRESQDLVALLAAEPGSFYRIRRVFHRA